MEFNKLITLVVGFIVLILLFIWISGKFRATTISTNTPITPTSVPTPTPTTDPTYIPWWDVSRYFTNANPVETPSITPTYAGTRIIPINTTSTPTKAVSTIPPQQATGSSTNQAKEFPQTGMETVAIPLSFVGMMAGFYLRKKA